MSDRPQFDYLDELAAQMKKAPSTWDDKKTAEGNWWAGVYSMIRALRARPVEPPAPDKEKTRRSPEGEAEQDAKLLSSKTSVSGVGPPVLSRAALEKIARQVEPSGSYEIERFIDAILESLSQEASDD